MWRRSLGSKNGPKPAGRPKWAPMWRRSYRELGPQKKSLFRHFCHFPFSYVAPIISGFDPLKPPGPKKMLKNVIFCYFLLFFYETLYKTIILLNLDKYVYKILYSVLKLI